MLFSEVHKIVVNKVTFIGFRRDDRPTRAFTGIRAIQFRLVVHEVSAQKSGPSNIFFEDGGPWAKKFANHCFGLI